MLGVKHRRVDGALQTVAMQDVPQEHRQRPLVLLIAARRTALRPAPHCGS